MANCEGCRYQSGELGVIGIHCNYLLITGHTRLGQMTEEQRREARRTGKCFHKQLGPQATVIEAPQEMYGIRRIPARKVRYDREIFRSLYDKGMTDSQMAREVGCAKEAVLKWRLGEGLPFHETKAAFDREKMLVLYRQGLSDAQIARELGCTSKTVTYWRKKKGLPPARKKETVNWKWVRRLYMAGCTDAETAQTVGCHESSIWKWRQDNQLPPNGQRGGKHDPTPVCGLARNDRKEVVTTT